MLLSSKATAVIPQQGRVRQLKHYIISIELFWKEAPEEKGKGARMVGRKKKPHTYTDNICSVLVQGPRRHDLNHRHENPAKQALQTGCADEESGQEGEGVPGCGVCVIYGWILSPPCPLHFSLSPELGLDPHVTQACSFMAPSLRSLIPKY